MLKVFLPLLLTGLASSSLAQQLPARPTGFPARRPLVGRQYSLGGLARPIGPAPTTFQLPAPLPTRPAATYASLPATPNAVVPADLATALPPAPRHDLTGLQGAPAYDLYQNLPEEFRKHTLRAPWAEPLPLQLLRGVLDR